MNGHPADSIHTYAMVVAMVNSIQGLGNALGPVFGGIITDALDYPWLLTIMGFLCSTVVSICTLNYSLHYL